MASEVPYLFGTPELKVDPTILSVLTSMCTPDKPFERTGLFGDIAFSEVCLSDNDTIKIKECIELLRTDEQKGYVSDVLDALQERAKKDNSPLLEKLTTATETEYKRLCKAFFIRTRCFIVIRNSTHAVIGRVIAFPDQISDDYGNNLDEHNEKGLNTVKVVRAKEAFESRVGSTLYLGHGQGATLAQLCACVADEPAVIFDPTFLSEVLLRNAFRDELPKKFKMEPRKEAQFPWNVLSYFYEGALLQYLPVVSPAIEVVAAELAKRKEEKEGGEEKKEGAEEEQKAEKKEVEQAEAFFAKRTTYLANGVLSPSLSSRAEKTNRYAASMLSDIYTDSMTKVKPGSYPYVVHRHNHKKA